MNGDLAAFMAECRARVDNALTVYLPADDNSHPLLQAMRYGLLQGGKRVRPVLVYASAQAVAATALPGESLDRIACALESIHAYSLIHDDLPAMDDDDLRRGQPSCHVAFGEANAILAGDALQPLAFELLSDIGSLAPETRLALIRQLAQAAGARGMVLGQALDLAAVDKQLTLDALETMHTYKTGALIRASVLMGALAGDASPSQLAALDTYARAVGLAFQVQDDILDVTADTDTLGKQQGADMARNKPTYVSLLGLEAARRKALDLHLTALTALAGFDGRADRLRQLSAYIVERRH